MFKNFPIVTKTEINLLSDNTGIFKHFETESSDKGVHEIVYYDINISPNLISPKRLLVYGDVGVYIMDESNVICGRIDDTTKYPHGYIEDNITLELFNEITK